MTRTHAFFRLLLLLKLILRNELDLENVSLVLRLDYLASGENSHMPLGSAMLCDKQTLI